MRGQESAPLEKPLRLLIITLDYPPPVLGGYGVMCSQVCAWLKQRGHEVLVLTTLPLEPGIVSAAPDAEEGAVPVRRILRSYWDGSANLDPPLQEALAIFCFVSSWTKRRAEQIGGWHFPRAEIVFPGLSPTEFPPLVEVPDRPWRWRLLWVGRVIEEKGIETAINAISYLPPDTTLNIVGPIEQAYRQRLEALAGKLGSHLNFPSHWRLVSRCANTISKPTSPSLRA